LSLKIVILTFTKEPDIISDAIAKAQQEDLSVKTLEARTNISSNIGSAKNTIAPIANSNVCIIISSNTHCKIEEHTRIIKLSFPAEINKVLNISIAKGINKRKSNLVSFTFFIKKYTRGIIAKFINLPKKAY
jgi:hypothetical protein